MTRRTGALVATLLVGTAVLAATVATSPGRPLFYALGVASGVVWIAGAYVAGPVPWRNRHSALSGQLGVGVAAGVACFAAFVVAKFIADSVPWLESSVSSVLHQADDAPRLAVLAVAFVSGAGEEVFFRGALYDAFEHKNAVLWTTLLYGLVTVTTLHVALVAAALVMGLVFALERRAFSSVLVPIVTHLTWTTLMLLYFPRT